MIISVVDKTGRAVRDESIVLDALGLKKLKVALRNVSCYEIAEAICTAKPFCEELYPDGEDWVGRIRGAGIELRFVKQKGGGWTVLFTLPFEYTEGVEYVLKVVRDLALEAERLREEVKWMRERLAKHEERLEALECAGERKG